MSLFLFSPPLLFCYLFNSDISVVYEAVVHLIRKKTTYISAGNGGSGWNVDLPCIILPPRKKQVQQQFCNIITIFYIATTSQRRRKEMWAGVSRGVSSKSRGEEEERSVVCLTRQAGSFQSKEMSWASALLGRAWGTCGCCCGGSCCCCCCCCGPPGGATLQHKQFHQYLVWLIKLK